MYRAHRPHRLVAAMFAVIAAAGALVEGLQAQSNAVQITWVGQACFMVQELTAAGGTPLVLTDPPSAAQGYDLPTQPADVVTISHNHADHNNSAGIRGSFTLVDGRPVSARTEVAAAGLNFVVVPGFHDNQNGAQRGQNSIIRWTQGGIRFAHFGDYGQNSLSDAQLADLGPVDVIFVPAGGGPTIDMNGVDILVSQLRPRVAVLMHYRTGLGGAAQTAPFQDLLGNSSRPIRFHPGRVSRRFAELPTTTEYWVMQPAAPMAAVNSAGFGAGQPVAPGSLVSLFGSFAGSSTAAATSTPLPRQLGTTEVFINNSAVPLLYASPQQVNVQLPAATAAGQYAVEVRVAGQRAARGPVSVLPYAPGLFSVLNQDGRLNSPAVPARRGEVLQLYATGQGAVAAALEDGTVAPSNPLIPAIVPSVAVGGTLAEVQFSGLAPLLVGVWQINIRIPQDAPTGGSVPVVVAAGLFSNTLPVAIQ